MIECNDIQVPLEPRLKARYRKLLESHMRVSHSTAPGSSAMPGGGVTAQACIQAASRFYNNSQVLLSDLAEPLLDAGRKAIEEECQDFGLVIHDCSSLTYQRHTSKEDRRILKHRRHVGYELQSALLVSDRTGQPLAPLVQDLGSREGMHSTRCSQVLPTFSPQDGMDQRIQYLASLALSKPLVHLADREHDSVWHYRRQVARRDRFLVRAKANRRVLWRGMSCRVEEVAQALELEGALDYCRTIEYHGRLANQFVGETSVVLDRSAKPSKALGGKRRALPGDPLVLRLVISEIRSAEGLLLARWMLLSNVEASVPAERLALWYYWRWQVECFYKLIKSAGHHLEDWEQESAPAIARRLLVASMACVLVWLLARDPTPEAQTLRTFLVRLSGRQMKHGRAWTMPALLEGMWVFLAMVNARDQLPQEEWDQLLAKMTALRPRSKPT
ncbi:MAG TPA: hypothetical protein VNT26_11725 [Candidatus Sulfotelmatobacter sp.]|nr:hypothetical protein [Candidatus Sulfotelmatobacter sp.]